MNGFDLSTISNCYMGSTPMSAIYYGSNKIWPTHDYSQDYLTIIPRSTAYVCYDNCMGHSQGYYSLDDGVTWTPFPAYDVNTWQNNTSVQVQANQHILLKDDPYTASTIYAGHIHVTEQYDVQGNIMSIIHGDNYTTQTYMWLGPRQFFYNESNLVNAKDLSLSLMTLTSSCYQDMFNGCTSLLTAPELPATTLATGCYRTMFHGCISLLTAPELPATTLATECYHGMFSSCTSLVNAPELHAATLVQGCYKDMFNGCTSLNYIKCLATNNSATDCTYYWTWNVGASGTFVKEANTTWTTGADGIPSGWTVQNA